MKIKQPIYLIAALAGVIVLFAGPSRVGSEIGLALGFILLFFGIYGISRRVTDAEDGRPSDAEGNASTDPEDKHSPHA